MKAYVFAILMNLLGAGLIGFGAEGCSRGSNAHGWAIFAGLCLIGTSVTSRKSDKDSDEEREE